MVGAGSLDGRPSQGGADNLEYQDSLEHRGRADGADGLDNLDGVHSQVGQVGAGNLAGLLYLDGQGKAGGAVRADIQVRAERQGSLGLLDNLAGRVGADSLGGVRCQDGADRVESQVSLDGAVGLA